MDTQFTNWAESCFRNRDCLKCASYFNGNGSSDTSTATDRASLSGAALEVFQWCENLDSSSTVSEDDNSATETEQESSHQQHHSKGKATARMVYVPSYKASVGAEGENDQGLFFGSVWSVPSTCNSGTSKGRKLAEIDDTGADSQLAVVDLTADSADLRGSKKEKKDKMKSVEFAKEDDVAVDDTHSAPVLIVKPAEDKTAEDKTEKAAEEQAEKNAAAKEAKAEKKIAQKEAKAEERLAEKEKKQTETDVNAERDKTEDKTRTEDTETKTTDEQSAEQEKKESKKANLNEEKKEEKAAKKQKDEETEDKTAEDKENEQRHSKKHHSKKHSKSVDVVAADFGYDLSQYVHKVEEKLGLVSSEDGEKNVDVAVPAHKETKTERKEVETADIPRQKTEDNLMDVATETEDNKNNNLAVEDNDVVVEPVKDQPSVLDSEVQSESSLENDKIAQIEREENALEAEKEKTEKDRDEISDEDELQASSIANLWMAKLVDINNKKTRQAGFVEDKEGEKCKLKRQRIAVMVKRDNQTGSDKFIELRLFSHPSLADESQLSSVETNKNTPAIEAVWKAVGSGDCSKVTELVDDKSIRDNRDLLKFASPFLETNSTDNKITKEETDYHMTNFNQFAQKSFPKFDGSSMPLCDAVEYACLIANATAKDRSVQMNHLVADKSGKEAMAIVKIEENVNNKKNNKKTKFISFMKLNPETNKIAEWNNYPAEAIPVNPESVVAGLLSEPEQINSSENTKSGCSLSQIAIPIILLSSVFMLWNYSATNNKKNYSVAPSAPGYEELLP